MKITVVTVCYNTVGTIERTMQSVLAQSYPDIEYIVIDGGSTDGTAEIINRYSDRLAYWVSEPDGGIYDAMNKGIAKATGEYINFMNAGDIFSTPDAVSDVFKSADLSSDIIYGNSTCQLPDGSEMVILGETDLSRLNMRPIYRHNASFVRTKVHKLIPFDLSKKKIFKYALDYNNIFTLYHKGYRFQWVDSMVVTYPREGVSDNLIENEILNFRIRNQFRRPSIKAYIQFAIKILRAWRRSIIR